MDRGKLQGLPNPRRTSDRQSCSIRNTEMIPAAGIFGNLRSLAVMKRSSSKWSYQLAVSTTQLDVPAFSLSISLTGSLQTVVQVALAKPFFLIVQHEHCEFTRRIPSQCLPELTVMT